MNMTNLEAIAILEDMKVKIDIPNAAVTQRKRNEALEMAIRALTNDEYVDAIMNEVMKKISVPTLSGDPVLPKVVFEEMKDPGYVPPAQRVTFTQTDFDPYAICKFNAEGNDSHEDNVSTALDMHAIQNLKEGTKKEIPE